MQALQLHEALGYSQYWNSPTSTISMVIAEALFVHKLNYFFRFRELEDSDENELTRGLLAVLRLSPTAHFAFLDMVKERQCYRSTTPISPSVLLGNEVDIRTQEGTIEREAGHLISVVLTREPWTTPLPVTKTDAIRCYDGVVYYGEEWIIILENKPKDEVPPTTDLERQMRPNLPTDSGIEICDRVVNLVWRDLLARFDGLVQSGMIHGSEGAVLRDFRALIHRRFPYLNPYSSIGACDGAGEPLEQRCRAILAQIAPERFDDKDALTFPPDQSHVGMIYLRPFHFDQRDNPRAVESICLEMFPALTVPQAQAFYRKVSPTSFMGASGLGDTAWRITPWLTFRCRADIRSQPEVLAGIERYFAFWQSRPEMIRGERDRELIAGEWWDTWASERIVRPEDRSQIMTRFSEKQKVNVCPGWRLRFYWSLAEATGMDRRRTSPDSSETAFVAAVREKIQEAFSAMGQKFGEPQEGDAGCER